MTHNKANIISPHELEHNSPYTLTINPSDKFQFWNETTDTRIKKAKAHILLVLNKLLPVKACLRIDVSRVGRIHWHGIINFPTRLTIREFYGEKVRVLTEEHQIEIDHISDMEKWTAYCNKVSHLWNVEVASKDCASQIKDLIMGGGSDLKIFAPMDRYLTKEDNNKSENEPSGD